MLFSMLSKHNWEGEIFNETQRGTIAYKANFLCESIEAKKRHLENLKQHKPEESTVPPPGE